MKKLLVQREKLKKIRIMGKTEGAEAQKRNESVFHDFLAKYKSWNLLQFEG